MLKGSLKMDLTALSFTVFLFNSRYLSQNVYSYQQIKRSVKFQDEIYLVSRSVIFTPCHVYANLTIHTVLMFVCLLFSGNQLLLAEIVS